MHNRAVTIQDKQKQWVERFAPLSSQEKYATLMELGRGLRPVPKEPDFLVPGCQAEIWLVPEKRGDLLFFAAYSDALISSGLAALLIDVYSGHTPQEILQTAAPFLKELGLHSLLSPGRANGLNALYLRIKQYALTELNGKTI